MKSGVKASHPFYKDGKAAYVLYGFVPSKIYESEQYCGGFHDANINHATYEKGTLTLLLDSRAWGVKSNTEYQLKIEFNGVTSVIGNKKLEHDKNLIEAFLTDKLIGNRILSAQEIPMIDYIFENLNLDKRYLAQDKRLLWMNVGGNEDLDLYIVFDKFSYEKYEGL